MSDHPVIECQDCGYILRHLTAAEEAQVAQMPQNFVWYCNPCSKERSRQWDL